MNRGSLK